MPLCAGASAHVQSATENSGCIGSTCSNPKVIWGGSGSDRARRIMGRAYANLISGRRIQPIDPARAITRSWNNRMLSSPRSRRLRRLTLEARSPMMFIIRTVTGGHAVGRRLYHPAGPPNARLGSSRWAHTISSAMAIPEAAKRRMACTSCRYMTAGTPTAGGGMAIWGQGRFWEIPATRRLPCGRTRRKQRCPRTDTVAEGESGQRQERNLRRLITSPAEIATFVRPVARCADRRRGWPDRPPE